MRGFGVNVQLLFIFLPGALRNFRALGNFTRGWSDIGYVTSPALSRRVAPLVRQSPETASATLYYENDKFGIRSVVNYHGSFQSAVPSGSVDEDPKPDGSSIIVDASAAYNLNKHIKLIAEVSKSSTSHRLTIDTTHQDLIHAPYFFRTYALTVNFRVLIDRFYPSTSVVRHSRC